MSEPVITSGDDPGLSLGLAALACLQAAGLYKQAEGVFTSDAVVEGEAGQQGNLVDALQQAMTDLGYSRAELQKVWLVFLAGHRAAVRAAELLQGEPELAIADIAARRRGCPLQDEAGCAVGELVREARK